MVHGNVTILNTLNIPNVNIIVNTLSPGSPATFNITNNTWTFGLPKGQDGSNIYSGGSAQPGGTIFGDIMTGLGVGLVTGGVAVAGGLTLQGQINLLQAQIAGLNGQLTAANLNFFI